MLITDSEELAAAVRSELDVQAAATKHSARVRQALSGPQSGVVLVEDLAQGIAACDAYAAEHLEIMTADAAAVAGRSATRGPSSWGTTARSAWETTAPGPTTCCPPAERQPSPPA